MAFTVEALDASIPSSRPTKSTISEFDLPSKEFIGYDPKGTTSITGSPISHKTAPEADVQQDPITEEAPAAPQEESVTLSPKVTALARKEQAARKREAELVAREKALEAKLADAEKYSQLKAKIAAKDFSAAEDMGLTHEEYTQHLLQKQASEDPADKRLRELEARLESQQKALEERSASEFQANQSLWRQEINRVVAGEEFSTIRELKAEQLVLDHINASFDEDGIELSAEDAAKEIENALLERAEKFSSVTKIKQKIEAPKTLPPPKTKTITQNMTVTSQKQVTKPFHLMSESEQIAEAYRRVQAAKQQR